MKRRSLEGLDISDVILANVHNMRFSSVHNALQQELTWLETLEKNLLEMDFLVGTNFIVFLFYLLPFIEYTEVVLLLETFAYSPECS